MYECPKCQRKTLKYNKKHDLCQCLAYDCNYYKHRHPSDEQALKSIHKRYGEILQKLA